MSWGFKITNTAKISTKVRWICIQRVDNIVHEMKALRQRAMQFASLEAITAFAIDIPLPSPEENEFNGPLDIAELVEQCLKNQQAMDELEEGSTQSDCVEEAKDEIEHKEDGIWDMKPFEPLEPFAMDTSQQMEYVEEPDEDDMDFDDIDTEEIDTQDTGIEDMVEDTDGDTAEISMDDMEISSCSDQDSATRSKSPDNNHDLESKDTLQETWGNSTLYELRKRSPLLTPWCQTLSTQLWRLLDQLEAEQDAPHPSREVCDETVSTHPTQRPLLKHAVTAEHLLKLHKHILDLTRFRDYLRQSLRDVADALNRCDDRYVMRESHRNMTTFMKSRGEGSPLVEGIAADEQWPDEATWGLFPLKTRRRKIYGCSELSKNAPSVTGWALPEEVPGKATRKIVW